MGAPTSQETDRPPLILCNLRKWRLPAMRGKGWVTLFLAWGVNEKSFNLMCREEKPKTGGYQ